MPADALDLVGMHRAGAADDATVAAAAACLDRFTERFNARDAAGVDAELHFPHVLFGGPGVAVWPAPGQHPADFFDALQRTGWQRTRYGAKRAVLVSADKVHFVVDYSRLGAGGVVLSAHRDLWVVVETDGRWGIRLRSH